MAHEHESHFDDLLSFVKGIIFFGTPHQGTDYAYWTTLLGRLANVPLLGSFRADLLQDLRSKSAALGEICRQVGHHAAPLKIVTIYEQRRIMGLSNLLGIPVS